MTETSLKERTPGRILVLGDDLRMVLPIVRSLGRRGGDIHLGWCGNHRAMVSSRYVARQHHLSLNPDTPTQSIQELLDCVEKHDFELIVPANDPATVFLIRVRNQLPDSCRFAIPNKQATDVVFDKQKTGEVAVALGIPIPDSEMLHSKNQLLNLKQRFPEQVALKPLSSTGETTTGKQFVQLFPDLETCARHWPTQQSAPFLLQEYISGEAEGVEFLASKGEILVAMQHRRLHETSGHGSTYRETMPLSSELLSATKRMINELNYTGVGMCEFRVNQATGRWVLLEINGRFWGSLPLAMKARIDFPWCYYQLLMQGRTEFPGEYLSGIRCRNLRQDLRWMWRHLTGNRSDKFGNTGWKQNSLSRWKWCCHLARLLCFRDSLDHFTWDDPRPFLEDCKELLLAPRRKLRKATVSEAAHVSSKTTVLPEVHL